MRAWKADLEAVAEVRVQRVGLSLSYETALARAGADGGGATWTGTPLELAVRADKLRLVEVLLEHGAAVAGKRVVDVPLYDAMEARRFGKYLRGLADDEKDNLIARPGDVERGFEDLDTLCGNIGAATAPAEAARLRALAAGHDARGSGRDVSAEFERRRRRALLWRCSLLLARGGCGDVLSFVAAGQKKGGLIFANGDMPDDVKGLREAREALEKCASLAYQVAKEYEDFPTPPATADDAEDALKARAAAVGKENPLGFDGKALAHAFQLVALHRLTNVVALEASLLAATNPSREGAADVIPGYLDAGGACASWLDAWLKAVKGNEARSAARVATALATAVSKWRESAPKLRDLVAAQDGPEQTLSSWKSAAKLKDFRPAKLAVAVASQKPKAAAAAAAAPAAAAAADEPKPALTAKQREKEKKRAKKQKQREEAERQAREAEDARAAAAAAEADRPPPTPEEQRAAAERRKKELADQAKREEAAAKERAARADRERKREEKAARDARRKLRDDARRELWRPAQTALAEVKARDLELKLKALPWATLVKRYGISVDEDELSGYERPDGAPGARVAARAGSRRADARQAHVLVADRVLGWFADRDGAWRDRALDVLGAVARGPLADPLKGKGARAGLRTAPLDGAMLLLYSAFKDASGAVGVLAWCAVRKANLDDFVEKILESLDRRAGVSEDEAPFLTLRADHVLLSPGKNTPMKLYVAACESLPGGRAPGAVKAAVGENRWRPDLRLTEKEAGAVADDGAPSMVLGRSGTGKTVCMARRIARDRADHADRELLFVARSQALCNFVRDAACRGDADARAAGEPRAAAKFLTVNDLLPLLEERTKNMAAGCKSDVRTPWRRMRYYRRVDGVDFRRDRDLRLTDEDYAKANGNYSSENDTDSSDDDSSDDDDGAGGARATQFGAMSFKVRGSCWPAADLVDFSRFRDEFWDKCGAERARKNESLSPTFCWVQIQSFIKGSVTPLIRGEPLERDEYIDESGAISKRRATGLSKQDREDCYDVFVSYERELRHRRLWDATDREVALIQRILEEGFVATTPLEAKRDGGAMAILDHVYCDEVQDMTQATLAVLLLAVGNRPERLFVCGDTAQAIQDGVAFRFSDLKETIYELQKEVKTRQGRGAAAMAAASDRSGAAAASKKLFKLTNNYRTHAGILGAANAVLDLLEQAFPNSVDVMEKDAGVSTGPRPTFSHERPVLDDLPNATLLMRAEPLRDARRRLAAERDDRKALVEEREGAVGASDDRDAVLDRADAALEAAAANIADEAEEAAAAWHAEVKAARKAHDAETKRRDADAKKRRAKRDAWLADHDKRAKKAKADLAKLAKKRARFEGADGDAGARRRASDRRAAELEAARAAAERVYNQRAREALDLWNTPSPMDANKHRVIAAAVVGGDAARVDRVVAGLVAEEVEADVLLGDMEEEDIADCIAPDPAAAQIRALIVRRGGARLLADPRALIGDYARALTPAAEASVAPLDHFVAVERRANADRCAAEDFDAQEAALRSASSAPRAPPADLDEPDLPALVKPTEDHSPAGRAAYKAEYVRARATAPTLAAFGVDAAEVAARAKRRKKASKAAERADAGAIDAEIRRRRAAAGLTPSALHCAELLDNKLVSTRVFSVQEFKGLEEEAVVLVDFFGSADKETARAWRDLFKARREGRGDFSDLSRRRALERDLKLLYTALTRPRSRLVILELTKEGAASDAAKFFTAKPADGAAPLAERHKRSTKEKKKSADGATLSADEWRSRGALIARVATERAEGDASSAGDVDARLGEARDCFKNAEDAELEHRCDAVIACAKAVKDVRAKVAEARGRDKGDRDDDDDAKPSAAEEAAAAAVAEALGSLALDEALAICKAADTGEANKALDDLAGDIETLKDALASAT